MLETVVCWTAALVSACTSGCVTRQPDYGKGWARGPALPEPIQEIHAAVLHDRIYIAGGFHAGNAISTAVYRLDTVAGRWEQVANLPEGRHHMPLAVVGDSLYAIGGLGPTPAATCWLYDERNDRWAGLAQTDVVEVYAP